MSNTETNAAQVFINLLDKSKANFLELEKILLAENQALEASGFKGDLFSDIVKQKEKKLEQIAEDIKERNLFLVNLDITPNQSGLENFLARLQGEVRAKVEARWTELEQILEKIQTANLVNARLTNNAQTHLDLMIQILQNASTSGKIYQAKGESKNINPHRDLGKA